MDSLLIALSLLSLLLVFVFAFVLFQALVVFFRWAYDRWPETWGKRPLFLRLPSRVRSVLLGCCFLALVL